MRPAFTALAAPLLLLPLAAAQERGPAPRTIDTIVTGGQVIDGTGAAPRIAELGVDGDRIVYVGTRPRGIVARRTINATGLTVAPGFIDPHTHSGSDARAADPDRRMLANHLLQGVTTIVIGNDGGGDTDIAGLFARLSANPTGPNVASFVGFGEIRLKMVGNRDRPPAGVEVRRMQLLTRRAMCDGALGLSAGLYYAPQSFARTNEVALLARIAGRHGGIYETHLRDEGSASIGLIPAIDEAIAIARIGKLPLQIAHIKALGADVRGMAPKVIAHIEAAQRAPPTNIPGRRRARRSPPPWSRAGHRMAAHRRWSRSSGRSTRGCAPT